MIGKECSLTLGCSGQSLRTGDELMLNFGRFAGIGEQKERHVCIQRAPKKKKKKMERKKVQA